MTQEIIDKIHALGFEEDKTVSLGAARVLGCRIFYCQRREVYLTDYDPFTHQMGREWLYVLNNSKTWLVNPDMIGDQKAFDFCIEV